MTVTRCDVAVVGAGPAGLMAAWRAAVAGQDVVVLEAAPAVGGMAASFEVAGQRVDLGSHRLHPAIAGPVLGELYRLLGIDLQPRRRHGRLRLADRWVAFPLRAVDLARHLPPRFAAGAALDALAAPLRSARSDTVSEQLRAGLGPTTAAWFYEPYIRKLWGVPADELDGELARRRVTARSAGAVLRRLVRTGPGPGRTFLYPRRGFGQLSEALADAAVASGAELRLDTALARIEAGAPELGLAHRLTASTGTVVEAPLVWSTMPLGQLVERIEPAAPRGIREAAASLTHRGMVLVYLVVPRSHYTGYDAHYLPAEDNPVSRLSEPKNYRDNSEDPPDTSVLCAEVPCRDGDDRWSMSDADLGAMVREALVRTGLPDPAPLEVVVRRLPRVYPDYRVGFGTALDAVESWIADQTGVITLGRQGLFVGDNTHHVLAMAWTAADLLGSDGSFDGAAWQSARAQFREHVVED